MPVGGVKMGEGPSDVGKTQPAGYVTGAINVIVIIVTDPIEVRGLPEDNPDQRGKREGDQKFLRLQTEAQIIHGGGRCESRVGARGTTAASARLIVARFCEAPILRTFDHSSGVQLRRAHRLQACVPLGATALLSTQQLVRSLT